MESVESVESVEAEGTSRFATFLENTGATGYVVHLSCEKALHAALAAKSRGVKIHVNSRKGGRACS